MKQRTVWVIDPDPAFRREAEKILRQGGFQVKGLEKPGRQPLWETEDIVLLPADLLPIQNPPEWTVALVSSDDGLAQAYAVEYGAQWSIPRDLTWLPQLPPILSALQTKKARPTFYQRLLEQMEAGIVMEDTEGILTFVSPRAAEMLGYAPEELIGRHYSETVATESQKMATAETAKRVDGIASQYECQLRHRDGRIVPMWIMATPVFEEGQFSGVMVIFRDISREKNLQEQFLALQQVAVAVSGQNTAVIFSQARSALRTLIEGTRHVLFAITDQESKTLHPATMDPENIVLKTLAQVLRTSPAEVQFPISRLPAAWLENLTRGQPCIHLDLGEFLRETFDLKAARILLRFTDAHSVIGLPLRSGGMLRGLVAVTLDREHVYREELDLAMAVAHLIATTLETHALEEQSRRRLYNLDRLFELTRAMATSLEPGELAAIAARQFIQALDVREVAISLWDREADALHVMVDLYYDDKSQTFQQEVITKTYYLEAYPATRKVIESQQPIQILSSEQHSDPSELAYMAEANVKTLIILPMAYQGKCIGIVELEDSKREQRLAPDQMSLAMTLAGQLAASLENARLFAAVQRREVQLKTSAEIARQATGILDIESLLARTVDLICDQFGFYYAAIYLLDREDKVVLRAATGEPGRALLAENYTLSIGPGSIIGTVAADGQPRIVNDVDQDPRYLFAPQLEETRAELSLPLRVRGVIIGVLDVQSKQAAAFSLDDVFALQILADQVANAIQNAHLYAQAQQRAKEQERLADIAALAGSTLDFDELLDRLMREAMSLVGAESCIVLLIDEENQELVGRYAFHQGALYPNPEEWIISMNAPGFSQSIFARGGGYYSNNVLNDPNIIPAYHPHLEAWSVKNFCGIALRVQERNIGEMYLGNHPEGFGSSELYLLRAVAGYVTDAIQNTRLFGEARSRAEELAALNELAQALTARLDVREVLEAAYYGTWRLLETVNFYIALYDPKKEELSFPLFVTESKMDWAYGTRRFANGLTEYVIRERTPLLIKENASQWMEEHGVESIGKFPHSWLGVPLVIGDHVLGVIAVQSHRTSSVYSDHDRNLLIGIASQVAIALQNALLYEEARIYAEELAAVNRIARAAGATLNLDDLMEAVYEEIISLFHADAFYIALYENKTNELNFRIQVDEGTREPPERQPLKYGLTGLVITEKKPLLIRNMEEEQGDLLRQPQPWGTMKAPASWLGVPMLIGDRIIGMISVQAYRPYAYGEREQLLLSTIAEQLAVAIDNARLYEQEHRRATQASLLNNIAQQTNSILSPQELLPAVAEAIHQHFDYDSVALMMVEPETSELVVVGGAGIGMKTLSRDYRQPLEQGITGWVARHGELLMTNDTRQEERYFAPRPDIYTAGSELAVPLKITGETVGVLDIQRQEVNSFDELDIATVQTMAEQIVLALRNARLYAEARRRAEELAALNVVAARLGQSLELQEILDAAMEEVIRTLAVSASAISLVDDETGDLVFSSQRGLRYSYLDVRIPQDQGLSSQVVQKDEIIITGDVGEDPRLAIPEFAQEQIKTMALVPMHSRGKVVGVLSAMCHDVFEFAERDITLLQAIANQMGTAVENAQHVLEVKEHAANLQEAYIHLQEADQLKDEMIQNVSHELRTPLTFLKSYLQLLLKEELGSLTEEQRQGLDVVNQKTQHLIHLVNGIVTLETVSPATLDKQPTDLGQLARISVQSCRPAAQEAGVRMQEKIPSRLPKVLADVPRISEVFDNLLFNAIKFSPDGGTITVRIKKQKTQLRVEVLDRGIGIPPEKLSRIFDRFYQVDGSTKRRFGGTGLGLAIVKRIIEAHGGEVGAQSVVGEGSTFYFTLPKA